MTDGTGPDRERLLMLALVTTSVLVLVAGSVIGVVAPGATVGGSNVDTGSHTNPESVSDSADLSAVERQMADRLATRVRSGSVNISQNNAADIRQSVNDSEYQELLDRYARVANETGHVNRSIAFRRVQSDQLEFTKAVEGYWDLYEWYRTIKSAEKSPEGFYRGTYASQELSLESKQVAQQLERKWRNVNESHSELVASQRRLDNLTASNETSLSQINRTVSEINQTHQTVRNEEFIRTSLILRPRSSEISFTDPLKVDGQLRTRKGRPVANRNLTFSVGNEIVHTQTDSLGRFDLIYRPTNLSVTTTTLPIRLIPENESLYLSSQQVIEVSIEQTPTEIDADVTPTKLAYGDKVEVSGTIGHGNVGASNVTYLVLINDQVIAQNTSGPTGEYNESFRVPAGVPSGPQSIEVIVPREERILSSANESVVVDVAESETTLVVTAEHVGDRTVRVSGSIETVAGRQVAHQQIHISANGTTLGTVTTGPSGHFKQTFAVPTDVGRSGPFSSFEVITLKATYDGELTNLQSDFTERTVNVSSSPIGVSIAGGVAVLVMLGVSFVATRRIIRALVNRPRNYDGPPQHKGTGATSKVSSADYRTLLSAVRDHIESERYEMAVILSYQVLRQRYAQNIANGTRQTPGSFTDPVNSLAWMKRPLQ
ncbi:hypothetical protein VB773_02275 [Haloarculaceae archaeon H-GB2-1]|nr:hypothetical protein [Haloarculaceae archaeon H-GB2-1]